MRASVSLALLLLSYVGGGCVSSAAPKPNTMERCGKHVSVVGTWMEGATAEDKAACKKFFEATRAREEAQQRAARERLLQAQEEHRLAIARSEARCAKKYRSGWWKDSNIEPFCAGYYYRTNKAKVRIGMTKGEVADLIGTPDENNRHVSATTVREQWVYRLWGSYFYFENNRLTSWQD